MKKIAAILLFLCISYQFVAKLGIIVWYNANIDYVAQELCENKDKPKLQCNGKCYLKKQLDKVDNQQKQEQQTPIKKIKSELPEYIASTQQLTFCGVYEKCEADYIIYRNHYQFQIAKDIFHPPA